MSRSGRRVHVALLGGSWCGAYLFVIGRAEHATAVKYSLSLLYSSIQVATPRHACSRVAKWWRRSGSNSGVELNATPNSTCIACLRIDLRPKAGNHSVPYLAELFRFFAWPRYVDCLVQNGRPVLARTPSCPERCCAGWRAPMQLTTTHRHGWPSGPLRSIAYSSHMTENCRESPIASRTGQGTNALRCNNYR